MASVTEFLQDYQPPKVGASLDPYDPMSANQSELDAKLKSIMDSDIPADQKVDLVNEAKNGPSESVFDRVLHTLNKGAQATTGLLFETGMVVKNKIDEATGNPESYAGAGMDQLKQNISENKSAPQYLDQIEGPGKDAVVGAVSAATGIVNPIMRATGNGDKLDTAAEGALGMGLDVALDPLTYLGGEGVIEKVGARGFARVAMEGGELGLGQKVLNKGISSLNAEEFAQLSKLSMDAGVIQEPLKGGLWFADSVQLTKHGGAGSKIASVVGQGSKAATRDSAIGRLWAEHMSGTADKQQFMDMIRHGTPEEARMGFHGIDGAQFGTGKSHVFKGRVSEAWNKLDDTLTERGVTNEQAVRSMELGAEKDPAVAARVFPEMTPEDAQATAQQLRDYQNFKREAANMDAGRDWVTHREDYVASMLSPEARELFGKPPKGASKMGAHAPAGLEEKAGIIPGGKFFGEDLLPATDTQLAELQQKAREIIARPGATTEDLDHASKLMALEKHPEGLTPRAQAQKIVDEKLGDDAVHIFSDDWRAAERAQINVMARRVKAVATETYLEGKGLVADIWNHTAVKSPSAVQTEAMRHELGVASFEAGVADMAHLAAQDAALRAEDAANAAQRGVQDALDHTADVGRRAREATARMREPNAAAGGLKEWADVQEGVAAAADAVFDKLGSQLAGVQLKVGSTEASLASVVADHADYIGGLAERLSRTKAVQQDVYEKASRAAESNALRITKAEETFDVRRALNAEHADVAANIERIEGRAWHGERKAAEQLAEARRELSAAQAALAEGGRGPEAIYENVARVQQVSTQARQGLEDAVQSAKQARDAMASMSGREFSSDRAAFEAATIQFEEAGRTAARHQETIDQAARFERQLQQELRLHADASLTEPLRAVSLAEERVHDIALRKTSSLEEWHAKADELQDALRKLGFDKEADAVVAAQRNIPTFADGEGLRNRFGTDWHNASPMHQHLRIDQVADASKGLTQETDNAIGAAHFAEGEELAAGFSGDVYRQPHDTYSTAKIDMRKPKTYGDPGLPDFPVEGMEAGHATARDALAPRKGWGRSEWDADIFKAAVEDGTFDIESAIARYADGAHGLHDDMVAHLRPLGVNPVGPRDLPELWDDVLARMDEAGADTWGHNGQGDIVDHLAEAMWDRSIVWNGDHLTFEFADAKAFAAKEADEVAALHELPALQGSIQRLEALRMVDLVVNRSTEQWALEGGDAVHAMADFHRAGLWDVQGAAESYTKAMRAEGFDGVLYPHGEDGWAAVPFDGNQVLGTGSQGSHAANAKAGWSPTGMTPEEYATPLVDGAPVNVVRSGPNADATMIDSSLIAAERQWRMEKASFDMHQIQVDQIGMEIDKQVDTLAAAKETAKATEGAIRRDLAKFGREVDTLTTAQRQAYVDSLTARFDAKDALDRAAQIEAEVQAQGQAELQGLYAESREAMGEQMAARGEFARAHTASLRLQGQAKTVEAEWALANRKVVSLRDGIDALKNDPQMLDQAVYAMRDGWAALSKSTQAPEQLAEVLHSMSKINSRGDLGPILKTFDYLTNVFKTYAIATPGFHFRNTYGGVINNALAGVDATSYAHFLMARDAYKGAVAKGLSHDDAMLKVPGNLRDAWMHIQEKNLLGRFGMSEEVRAVQEARKGQGVLSNTWTRTGYKASAEVEQVLRGSLLMDRLLKGSDPMDALQDVFKYHFDYDDLSDFERDVMKRVVPFYTWLRKNLPLQLESLVLKPKWYSRYMSAKNVFEAHKDPNESLVPGWYTDQSAIATGINIGGGPVHLMPNLPINDLAKLTNPREALGSINPVLKTPVELVTGQQLYNGQKFREGYVPVPKVYEALGLGLMLQAFGQAERDKDGNLQARDGALYAMEQFMPAFGRARRLAPSEDKYQNRILSTYGSFLFGIGARENTPQDQANELKNRTTKIDAKAKDMRSLGYGGYFEKTSTYSEPTKTGGKAADGSYTPSTAKRMTVSSGPKVTAPGSHGYRVGKRKKFKAVKVGRIKRHRSKRARKYKWKPSLTAKAGHSSHRSKAKVSTFHSQLIKKVAVPR